MRLAFGKLVGWVNIVNANCSLSFPSAIPNTMWGRDLFERRFWIPVPPRKCHKLVPSLYNTHV